MAVDDYLSRQVPILKARDFPIAGLWHIVHWRDRHLSAAAQAFRGSLHSQAPQAPRTKR